MQASFTRRRLLEGAILAAGASSATLTRRAPAADPPARPRFRYALNTSTIRGQQLGIAEQVEVAAQAGYDGIEVWVRDVHEFVELGGRLEDLKKRIDQAGLVVESAIGFAPWIVDDDNQRKQGLETAKRDMAALRQIGGRRIAAPPAGATRQRIPDLFRVADRFRTLVELGVSMDVRPQLELWGFSATLSRLGELALVAVECGHPEALLLPDVYHIYKGGSSFAGLQLLNGRKIEVFHMNDYPENPPRDQIGDADRVYPGDGVAPLSEIVRTLQAGGFQGVLSLELFNREYWEQPALEVARTGLQKMQQAVTAAFPT